ncbi:GNAT family N-acetyltransferase [Allorhizocola rhizosphaerae]|uniref:GNAT family N-acetyltransferase n=1 Tax=Allorhizocola rhizosphaerae TaxID=1872709 RepID=UPI000E3C6CD8|nr:GNAT family N-acetyltransferase [Allorhizocola rhizosphaerae]
MRVHESGAMLDPSPSRLDLDRVERWLATETYWARGRPRADIVKSIENSMVWGLYTGGGEQAGFFRVVTDKTTFAWLCDVFIDRDHRGRGLASWALAHIRDELLATGVYRILLATSDAHAVYEKLGFTPHAEPEKWMELTTRRIGES